MRILIITLLLTAAPAFSEPSLLGITPTPALASPTLETSRPTLEGAIRQAIVTAARLSAEVPALDAWGYDYPVTRARRALWLRHRLRAHRATIVDRLLSSGKAMDDAARDALIAARDQLTRDIAASVEVAVGAGLEASASPFVDDSGLHEIKAGLVALGHDAHQRYDAYENAAWRTSARREMLAVRAALTQIDRRLQLG